MSLEMFVGGLSPKTTKDDLIDYFEPFGDVLDAKIIFHKKTKMSKGYGFVVLKSIQTFNRLKNSKLELHNRKLDINIACKKAEAPQEIKDRAKRIIYVSGFPEGSTDAAVFDYFSAFGEVQKGYLIMNPKTNQPRNFGFVEFKEEKTANHVLKIPEIVMNGNNLRVAPYKSNVTQPKEGSKKPKKKKKRKKLGDPQNNSGQRQEQNDNYFTTQQQPHHRRDERENFNSRLRGENNYQENVSQLNQHSSLENGFNGRKPINSQYLKKIRKVRNTSRANNQKEIFLSFHQRLRVQQTRNRRTPNASNRRVNLIWKGDGGMISEYDSRGRLVQKRIVLSQNSSETNCEVLENLRINWIRTERNRDVGC